MLDNHMYETATRSPSSFPPRTRGLIKYVQVDGRTKIAVKNVISEYIPNPTFEVVAKPGAQQDYFRRGNKEGKSRREILGQAMKAEPAFFAPQPRLARMDELGIDRAIMWPTLASLLEERLADDPVATHVVVHALNEWMHEHWTFNYEDRIYATPVITLPIVERRSRSWTGSSVAALASCSSGLHPFRGWRALARSLSPSSTRSGRGLPRPRWRWACMRQMTVRRATSSQWEGARGRVPPVQEPERLRGGVPELPPRRHGRHGVGDLPRPFDRFPDLRFLPSRTALGWVGPLLETLAHVYETNPHLFAQDPR